MAKLGLVWIGESADEEILVEVDGASIREPQAGKQNRKFVDRLGDSTNWQQKSLVAATILQV